MGFISGNYLDLQRCPYCNVHKPNIELTTSFLTKNSSKYPLYWSIFECSTCGGAILVRTNENYTQYDLIFPDPHDTLDNSIPQRASEYLLQSIESKSAPAGSIMLSASSIDAMLKAKGFKTGSLFDKINKATEDHVLTEDMNKWAHQIRLDANEQRHDDEDQPLPQIDDAEKCIDFAVALAELLFVLPSKVTKGIENSAIKTKET